MKAIEIYNEKIVKLLEDAKKDRIVIQPYATRIEGTDIVVEVGIAILDGEEVIEIPTYCDETALKH